MQLRSLTPKTRIQFSSHTFFKFLFPKKFWRRPGTPGTSRVLARLLRKSTSKYGRGQSRTVPAQKWTCPPSIPLVISPQYTVTERSLKNESDVRNKMCKAVPGPMQAIVWWQSNLRKSSEKASEKVKRVSAWSLSLNMNLTELQLITFLKTEVNKSKVAGYASVDRDTRSLSYLQHPEPSGSSSQDFSLPIQDMMNPVVFWDNRDVWTYAVKGLTCSAHSEGT
jgi:hypothetical protein